MNENLEGVVSCLVVTLSEFYIIKMLIFSFSTAKKKNTTLSTLGKFFEKMQKCFYNWKLKIQEQIIGELYCKVNVVQIPNDVVDEL